MFGNWGFLLLVYVLPLLLPDVRFMTLAPMLFLFAEVLMHLVLFPIRLGRLYNPGQATAVFGLGAIACVYFTQVFDPALFVWYDYICAVVWFVAVFLFCFRSSIYWNLGKVPGYELGELTAYGAGYTRR